MTDTELMRLAVAAVNEAAGGACDCQERRSVATAAPVVAPMPALTFGASEAASDVDPGRWLGTHYAMPALRVGTAADERARTGEPRRSAGGVAHMPPLTF